MWRKRQAWKSLLPVLMSLWITSAAAEKLSLCIRDAYFAGLTKVGEYSVYEQGNYSSERCYTTPEGVCAYRIGAETLGEIITKATITFRCLS